MTQLIAQIRRVGRQVPGAQVLISEHCTRLAALTGQDYTAAGKPPIAWDDPAALDGLVSALVGDALALLAVLDVEAISQAGGRAADAVALLALVAGQDVEPAEDSDGSDGRWRIARATVPDRVISTVDPDARHAHKTRQRRQDGYKAHVVVEPDTGLATAVKATKASGTDNSDASVGAALLREDTTVGQDASVDVLADSAYGTGDMLHALDQAGHEPIIKPWPLRPAVPEGFTLDDFVRDSDADTVTCPAGVTRPVSAKNSVAFGSACSTCPLRQRCTTATSGRKLKLHKHDLLLREHRKRATDQGFQATYRQHRPMVERSIAWLTRGARRVPYRGIAKNNTRLHHRAAAVNLRRLLTLGLHLEDRTWVLT